MAGGRFNNPTEAGYAPVEGELLGIASALHKTRYFISGHPEVTVITDHLPIVNFLQDRSKTINNKRLLNLRRKCDGFIFKTGYSKGLENTTDALSRIQDWSSIDPERLESVDDFTDSDDNQFQIMTTRTNISDLAHVIQEVKPLDVTKDIVDINNAMLGSWITTPSHTQLEVLMTMYGRGGWDEDNQSFSDAIYNMDYEREVFYNSKTEVSNDLDNDSDIQHQVCAAATYGHSEDSQLGSLAKDRAEQQCFAANVNERKFYSIT